MLIWPENKIKKANAFCLKLILNEKGILFERIKKYKYSIYAYLEDNLVFDCLISVALRCKKSLNEKESNATF